LTVWEEYYCFECGLSWRIAYQLTGWRQVLEER
jgi:hypothetical protein